ncbi:MAG: 50S ribosomal protein L24 [Candidatus Woesearchaeota archaeon]
MRSKFSPSWKASVQPRKQRKYVKNAPLHIKRRMISAHLSKELREKYGRRNVQLRKGDRVKVLRGSMRGRTGTVESIELKSGKVRISGVEMIRKDGTKVKIAIHPSNLMIIELNLNDKKRAEAMKK